MLFSGYNHHFTGMHFIFGLLVSMSGSAAVTGYLKLALVFALNGTLREEFLFFGSFCKY